jgi:hypothetical protein
MQKISQLTDVPSIALYLGRIGAVPRSIRVAIIEEKKGKYWEDKAYIRFDPKARTVEASIDEHAPTEEELEAIVKDMGSYQWPGSKLLGKTFTLPLELQGESPDNIFEFRNKAGQLIMLQQRTEKTDRSKYRPWAYFDDDVWRMTEPDGPLPLWGMEYLKDHTTVFIHEGAKAARAVHRMLTDRTATASHPWGIDMSGAAHLGWIGGALNPSRTDWSQLAKSGVKQAYIVADNDEHGVKAVPRIARQLQGISVFSVEFNKQFPDSFDLADPWPADFYKQKGDVQLYRGPGFEDHLQPATWATSEFTPPGAKKPVIVLRNEFKRMWAWVKEVDLYVCVERPTLRYPKDIFDGYASAFSHGGKPVSGMLKAEWGSQLSKLAYRPDSDERIISHSGELRAINVYSPSRIGSSAGDAAPWLDFMRYLFPDPVERHEVMRWCATLIARTDIRMGYAVLLVTETQGIGKNTLGEKILAPLVGRHNCSFPNERELVESQFNSWLVNKRFAFIGEIYTGRSWKAANLLKSYITDRETAVNEKFIRSYTTENWIHVMACSNSLRALKLDNTDRRWMVPTLTETPWPHAQWVAFNDWIEGTGLNIIRRWAENFGDYVKVGQHAPMTERKREMQRESESEAVQLLRDWCEAHIDVPISVAEEAIKIMLQNRVKPLYESKLELRRVMERLGWVEFPERLTIDSMKQTVMMSPMVAAELASHPKEQNELRKWIRTTIQLPIDSESRTV